MCGRYLLEPGENFEKRFNLANTLLDHRVRTNISPGQESPIIVRKNENEVISIIWGFIPHWSTSVKKVSLINARAESISIKSAFKEAFLTKRCLVPASGFYEWKNINGFNTPFLFRKEKGELFSMAGLYDTWTDPNKGTINTFTIITTNPNREVSNIHNRMPVMLEEKDENLWLNPHTSQIDLQRLLHPFSQKLSMEQVSIL